MCQSGTLTKAILAYALKYVKEPFVRLFVLLNDCEKNLARFFSLKNVSMPPSHLFLRKMCILNGNLFYVYFINSVKNV